MKINQGGQRAFTMVYDVTLRLEYALHTATVRHSLSLHLVWLEMHS